MKTANRKSVKKENVVAHKISKEALARVTGKAIQPTLETILGNFESINKKYEIAARNESSFDYAHAIQKLKFLRRRAYALVTYRVRAAKKAPAKDFSHFADLDKEVTGIVKVVKKIESRISDFS